MMKLFLRTHVTKGGILIGSSLVSYFFNFLFNAYLGRVLPLEQFSLIALVTSIWYLIVIVLNALSASVNHEVAYLHNKSGNKEAFSYFLFFTSKTIVLSTACGILWFILTPFILTFFHLQSFFVIAVFAPLIVLGALASINRGYLQAILSFTFLAIIVLVESISRLIFAVFFVLRGDIKDVYLAIPLSITLGFLISWYFVRKYNIATQNEKSYAFPRHFFLIMLLTNISSTAFLTIDIVLVKHYFSAFVSGTYALLALIGKIVYFLGSLLNSILFTVISRKREQGTSLFYLLLLGTSLILLLSFIAFGIFGQRITPLLFGNKVIVIFPYLLNYTLGMCLFTLTATFTLFHLALKQYIFAGVSSAMAFALSLGILLFHNNLFQIVNTILTVSLGGFVVILTLHVRYRHRLL